MKVNESAILLFCFHILPSFSSIHAILLLFFIALVGCAVNESTIIRSFNVILHQSDKPIALQVQTAA
jgi:hypothetical protein